MSEDKVEDPDKTAAPAEDEERVSEARVIREARNDNLIRIIMPSVGDMQLVSQDGGVLLFKPVYFGGECAGPIVQRVVAWEDGTENVTASYRIKIRSNGELKLAKAD